MAKNRFTQVPIPLILGIVLFLVPLFLRSQYHLHILIWMCVLVMLVSGLRLLYMTGQISFAHAGFTAIGAYVSALLVLKGGLSFWAAMPLAGVVSGVVSLLVGYPTLRTKGVYFFMATFSFGIIVMLIVATYWQETLGGYTGLTEIPPPDSIAIPGFTTIDFVGKIPFYYLALILATVCTVIMYRFNRSRTGMILKSIRQADSLTESSGINVMRYKMIAFTVACFFAGVAGSFLAHYFHAIGPETFTFDLSVSLVIYMLVGGRASISGPIVGVFVLTVLAEVFRSMGGAGLELLFYGLALIVFVTFLPEGLTALPSQARSWVTRLKG